MKKIIKIDEFENFEICQDKIKIQTMFKFHEFSFENISNFFFMDRDEDTKDIVLEFKNKEPNFHISGYVYKKETLTEVYYALSHNMPVMK